MLGVKFGVFCRALKPVLSLSKKGFGLRGPHNRQWGKHPSAPLPPPGYAPVQRPHVTSIMASGRRASRLKIGKDRKDRKYPFKLYAKTRKEIPDKDGVMPDVCPALSRGPLLWKTAAMLTNTMRYKRQSLKICTSKV